MAKHPVTPFHLYSQQSVTARQATYNAVLLAYFLFDTVLDFSQKQTFRFYKVLLRRYLGDAGNITTSRLQIFPLI